MMDDFAYQEEAAMTQRNAPAKINLALDILGLRPDGYHDLKMVMQSVSLGDTVALRETAEDFTLKTDAGFLRPGRKTMEQQAAEAFFSALGRPLPPLEVHLTKRTPAYAGLGGGSADVAALLRLLRDAYAPDLPAAELERIGLSVGSDVPFCLRGGTCLAEGRGEALTDLPPLPPCALVICKPDFDLPTPQLFARADQAVLSRRPDVDGLAAALGRGDLAAVGRSLGNVFEEVLSAEEGREVAAIRASLEGFGALGSAMSGSGPAVFGIFPSRQEALGAAEALGRRYRQTFLAEPVKKLEDSV